VQPKKIVHNISDLARFGYILDTKLEKKFKKESMKVKYWTKKLCFPSKKLFSIFSKFQHLKNQYN
jgi:hypothetical protein